ncbi:MAG: tRNA (guanosine(46)-N7)-methyltransferase TrmB [Rhodospirillales bacterium]
MSGPNRTVGASSERFYGRRTGKPLRPGRQRLMDERLPALRIDPAAAASLDDFFAGAVSALWLEIGFGGGEHLAHMAATHPDIGIIGCEPFVNGVASLLSHIDERGLGNVRIFDDDARDLLAALPDGAFERVFLLYPDPWPKTRHHRRRFVNRANLDELARLLADGGMFRFASDHMDYVRWTLDHVGLHPEFEWTAEAPADWRTRPDDAIETRYEAKAKRQGATCVYLNFRRVPRRVLP